jgi:hypothetical protein
MAAYKRIKSPRNPSKGIYAPAQPSAFTGLRFAPSEAGLYPTVNLEQLQQCPTPVARDEQGKLSYDAQLRAPEERRRRLQTFAGAVAESFGSGSSSAAKFMKTQHSKSSETRSSKGDGSRHSTSCVGDTDDQEVQSPLKQQARTRSPRKGKGGSGASRQLNLQEEDD